LAGRSAALYFFFGLALEQKHFALHVTTVGPQNWGFHIDFLTFLSALAERWLWLKTLLSIQVSS
jgi:hypothetical protein